MAVQAGESGLEPGGPHLRHLAPADSSSWAAAAAAGAGVPDAGI